MEISSITGPFLPLLFRMFSGVRWSKIAKMYRASKKLVPSLRRKSSTKQLRAFSWARLISLIQEKPYRIKSLEISASWCSSKRSNRSRPSSSVSSSFFKMSSSRGSKSSPGGIDARAGVGTPGNSASPLLGVRLRFLSGTS